jgi:hypothetical protein
MLAPVSISVGNLKGRTDIELLQKI